MNEAKEEVRSRLAIEDVIGEYVSLKRSGRYYKGLSPFNQEKTPSFYVTPDRDIWHDFSSGKGGDIFSFIMEVEGLSFMESLEMLANKANVDLSLYKKSGKHTTLAAKDRLYRINNLAMNYYQRSLTKSKVAMEYVFSKRKLNKEIVLEWGIGYADVHPNLKQALLKKGFNMNELRSAGILSSRGNEMFRSRMMVPLRDGQGQIVGFTGRIIGDGQPKYINTPATILYDKGRQLFGLNFAKNAIRQKGYSVLVEGNLDVISSHQAGVKNVVGVAGTALTANHLKSLSRLSPDMRFCFDADRAGISATERAIKLSRNLNLKLSVIDLSNLGSKDPDELIKEDPKKWLKAIDSYRPAVDWVIERYKKQVNLNTADGKKVLTTKVLDLVRYIDDPVEQEFYIKKLADLTDTTLDALTRKLNKQPAKGDESPRPLKSVKIRKNANLSRNEDYYIKNIFALSLRFKGLRSLLKNFPDRYLDEDWTRLRQWMTNESSVSSDGAKNLMKDIDSYNSGLLDKLAELELIANRQNSSTNDARIYLMDNFNNLEKLKINQSYQEILGQLARAVDDNSDDETVSCLEAKAKNLQENLKLINASSRRNSFDGLRQLWQKRRKQEVY